MIQQQVQNLPFGDPVPFLPVHVRYATATKNKLAREVSRPYPKFQRLVSYC